MYELLQIDKIVIYFKVNMSLLLMLNFALYFLNKSMGHAPTDHILANNFSLANLIFHIRKNYCKAERQVRTFL